MPSCVHASLAKFTTQEILVALLSCNTFASCGTRLLAYMREREREKERVRSMETKEISTASPSYLPSLMRLKRNSISILEYLINIQVIIQ